MDDEVGVTFSRREPTKHFSAQINIWMYSFVHTSKAQSAERLENVFRFALCALRFLLNRLPLLFH